MDNGAHKLLESATQRTLHAHAFSRSSTQASLALTDLLSRYLALLASTSAKYAQHAGRTKLSVRDIVGALDELGVGLDELSDYASSEAKELNRYALYSARRVEDLMEFKSQLLDGLRQDRDDAIPLEYTRYTTPPLDSSDDEEGSQNDQHDMDVDEPPALWSTTPSGSKRRPSIPPLSPSPISNPSPLRKRPRTSSWQPPSHIPDFLPPFPTADAPSTPELRHTPHTIQPLEPPPSLVENVKIEKPPLTLPQPITSSAASDILVQVPYSQSTLSTVPEWHLPSSAPPAPLPQQNRPPRLPGLLTEPSLFAAYHHILTHPPPAVPPTSNPARHRVAMALLHQTQTTPRWEPADTLYASVGPCPPRVAVIGPSYPTAIDTKGEGKEKDIKFPPTISRPVSASERLTPLISQQVSRIPDLARHVLPPTILARTSRLTHPPVLHRGTKPLTYGNGIPAPWNANVIPSVDAVPPTPLATKVKDVPQTNGKETPQKPVLPDARLYATWDFEPKDFKVPLAPTRTRTRLGSIHHGGGSMILPAVSRSKGTK
ncbi:hypothetical protein K443DRAFT_671409 [Laccaria amethystina LaAM-08-1]|uniref:Bromodomain associated domain-containing protein n=1 Tax=Laccaria amethystina LaAM-08-1 TaxID=1095629 RepID=A0A0C9XX11_9AGAR|nr:hypothetical protein K443DRAFT_671409 [Laccaria amethystina LaAM-08-1]